VWWSLGDVEWCECECGCVCGGSMGMCVCLQMVVGGCVWCVVWCVWFGVCVRLNSNRLGAEGGAAMAGAVQRLTSLRTLKYVCGWMA
jgi:hypothetical protein